MTDLVLASSSPRRALLLSSAGFTFSHVDPKLDETPLDDESPEERVVRLARAKALAIDHEDSVVLGADTAVVLDGVALGKPIDRDDAIAMLGRLGGRIHVVISGWALARRGAILEDGFEATLVSMRAIAAEEAAAYADTGEPMDKAGAYGLQGEGKQFVTGVAGPRSTVIGLPLEAVVKALQRAGVEGDGRGTVRA